MVLMKSRSELREIVMKILYQVFILKEASVEFDVEKLKKEQLEIENDFVNELLYGILDHQKEIVEKATVQAMGNNKYGNIEESELQSEKSQSIFDKLANGSFK